jgi:hypothetical protein
VKNNLVLTIKILFNSLFKIYNRIINDNLNVNLIKSNSNEYKLRIL